MSSKAGQELFRLIRPSSFIEEEPTNSFSNGTLSSSLILDDDEDEEGPW